MERSAVSRQYLAVVRQQLLADDPGVSARSSSRRRRRCVLAASAHDGTSLEDNAVVEQRLTVDGGPLHERLLEAGSGHASSTHGFSQLDTSTRLFVRRLFLSTDTFKLSFIRVVSVHVGIKSAACACRSVRPARTQRCRKQRETISSSSAYTGVATGAMSPKRTETTET